MVPSRVFKAAKVTNDPEAIEHVIERGSLGQKLSLYRAMKAEDHCRTECVGLSILDEMMGRHKRVDHREHHTMVSYMAELGFEVVHLNTGDGDFSSRRVSIERKEDDLLDSLFDDRRLRQLGAMREEAEFSYLIVTKGYEYVKAEAESRGVSERVVTGFVASLCAVGYPPLFIPDRFDASQIIHRIVEKVEDDVPRVYVPRPPRPAGIEYRNAIIESFPKVGAKTRRRLTNAFPSLHALCEATIEELMEVEGVGPSTAQRIYEIIRAE